MPPRIRVAIVEDNRLFRETLELLFGLRDELEVVASVAGGTASVEACALLAPDVAVVDYRMPGLDGAQAAGRLRELSPATQVVCLTASISEQERALLLLAGAACCLTKDESLERIVEAIVELAGTP